MAKREHAIGSSSSCDSGARLNSQSWVSPDLSMDPSRCSTPYGVDPSRSLMQQPHPYPHASSSMGGLQTSTPYGVDPSRSLMQQPHPYARTSNSTGGLPKYQYNVAQNHPLQNNVQLSNTGQTRSFIGATSNAVQPLAHQSVEYIPNMADGYNGPGTPSGLPLLPQTSSARSSGSVVHGHMQNDSGIVLGNEFQHSNESLKSTLLSQHEHKLQCLQTEHDQVTNTLLNENQKLSQLNSKLVSRVKHLEQTNANMKSTLLKEHEHEVQCLTKDRDKQTRSLRSEHKKLSAVNSELLKAHELKLQGLQNEHNRQTHTLQTESDKFRDANDKATNALTRMTDSRDAGHKRNHVFLTRNIELENRLSQLTKQLTSLKVQVQSLQSQDLKLKGTLDAFVSKYNTWNTSLALLPKVAPILETALEDSLVHEYRYLPRFKLDFDVESLLASEPAITCSIDTQIQSPLCCTISTQTVVDAHLDVNTQTENKLSQSSKHTQTCSALDSVIGAQAVVAILVESDTQTDMGFFMKDLVRLDCFVKSVQTDTVVDPSVCDYTFSLPSDQALANTISTEVQTTFSVPVSDLEIGLQVRKHCSTFGTQTVNNSDFDPTIGNVSNCALTVSENSVNTADNFLDQMAQQFISYLDAPHSVENDDNNNVKTSETANSSQSTPVIKSVISAQPLCTLGEVESVCEREGSKVIKDHNAFISRINGVISRHYKKRRGESKACWKLKTHFPDCCRVS